MELNYNEDISNKKLLEYLFKNSKLQYQDILIYNELKFITDNNLNKNIENSLVDLMNLYDKLYSMGFSIAGFQFLGLAISAIDKPTSFINKLAYFIISINFVTSISSSLLSFYVHLPFRAGRDRPALPDLPPHHTAHCPVQYSLMA